GPSPPAGCSPESPTRSPSTPSRSTGSTRLTDATSRCVTRRRHAGRRTRFGPDEAADHPAHSSGTLGEHAQESGDARTVWTAAVVLGRWGRDGRRWAAGVRRRPVL